MLGNGIYRFYSNKQELDNSIIFYQNEARTDIKNDKVKELVGGLLLPPRNKSEYVKFQKKDFIRKKYGIVISGNCIVSESMEILKKEYKKISEPYLEKRNGKNWREKMEKEIDAIK
jgi:metal-dependent hydrolase (beta-lactamase superfamily II)